ncbi:DUF839 domain-containing protein [Thiomicrorhabdus sp. zzn3]|uniref:alkaline phosphatase PhoX n=1 Tax=Thiomicrorhabdus sp. zzn3 TaxID=3039775 RepID=UPI0024363547|nr:alkaline phosphatase PhoX [Thiomicrorhabdus sp. zzn3]MDG6777112.1 DUF839 domain-containing protein [Thiomicrorhabdus sp. zzn3]
MQHTPLFSLFSSVLLVWSILGCEACAQTEQASLNLQFQALQAPNTPTEQNQLLSTVKASVNGKQQTIGYHTLFTTGERNNQEIFGLVKDVNEAPILFKDGSPYVCNGTNDGIGSGLDHVSILQKNGKLYMVSQYECVIGAMYLSELQQDAQGYLSVKPNSLRYIDQSVDFGGYVHCAGQTTPWQSHLGSEEYEPDARYIEKHYDASRQSSGNRYYDELALYWQNQSGKQSSDSPLNSSLNTISPYFYGWIPEVTITETGDPHYRKHFSMGRFSHELAYVMPDQKTVYLSDDGTNGGFYLFIADRPQDLSAGTLYAARWQQTSDKGLGEAQIHWISLGHARDRYIRQWVAKKLHFSDLFASAQPNSTGLCPSAFVSINTSAGHECLQLKDINGDQTVNEADAIIASRLETRRMAAYMGATTEFRKGEGITFNPHSGELYLSLSEIARGMENYAKKGKPNAQYDQGGGNHIHLRYNPCGGVYALPIHSDMNMKSDYIVQQATGLIAGKPTADGRCETEYLANPDNISFLADSNSLIIGEDSDRHRNNFVWSFDPYQQTLTRIFSAPQGAEATSTFWHGDINGYAYLTLVTQHPLKNQAADARLKQSQAGYIGPFKLTP